MKLVEGDKDLLIKHLVRLSARKFRGPVGIFIATEDFEAERVDSYRLTYCDISGGLLLKVLPA